VSGACPTSNPISLQGTWAQDSLLNKSFSTKRASTRFMLLLHIHGCIGAVRIFLTADTGAISVTMPEADMIRVEIAMARPSGQDHNEHRTVNILQPVTYNLIPCRTPACRGGAATRCVVCCCAPTECCRVSCSFRHRFTKDINIVLGATSEAALLQPCFASASAASLPSMSSYPETQRT